MSILIKGMVMPKCCRECQFMDYSGAEGNHCSLTWEFNGYIDFGEERREEHCPLIEVPPHGRLIDADALRNEWIWGTTDRLGYTKCIEVVDLDDAPTIIENEE